MKAATSPKHTEEDKTLQQKFQEQIKLLEGAIDANRSRLKEIKKQVRNKPLQQAPGCVQLLLHWPLVCWL